MTEPNLYQQPEDSVFIGGSNANANLNINPNPIVKDVVKDSKSIFLDNYLKENPDKAKDITAPLTGKDIHDLMARYGNDFTPTQQQFELWKQSEYPEKSASWSSQIGGAFSHLLSTAIETPVGLYEVGTKEKYKDKRLETLGKSAEEGVVKSVMASYNMLAVEPNPDKGVVNSLFRFERWSRSTAGNLTPEEDKKEQYKQFLEDYRMMNWYKDVASGKKGFYVDSVDEINPKVVESASLAIDVLSFEAGLGALAEVAKPIASAVVATEAGQYVKMSKVGQTLSKIPEFTSAVKTGIVGGTIKYTGQALEVVGGTVKNTIKWGIDTGSDILESATGFDAKSWKAGIKFTGLGGSAFDVFSHGISGVGAKVGAGLAAAGGARMVGEGLSALGETILKNSGKRGFLTFAEMALDETPNLSRGAKGVLKAIQFADPFFSYASTATEGLLVGGAVGAGFGFVTEGTKGIPSGIGGGAAFGLLGGLGGRAISDIAGYTRLQYGAVQAKYVLENWKETKPDMHKYWNDALNNAKNNSERASIIQQITGIDLVAPNVNWYAYKPEQIESFLRERGVDMEGYKVDKETGVRIKDSNGNDIKAFGATGIQIANSSGFTYVTEHGINGEVKTQSVFIKEGEHGDAGRHELAHTIFKGTKMYDDFMKKMHSVLLGKYNEKGEKLSNAHIDPDSFREFYRNYLENLYTELDSNGNIKVDGKTTDAYKQKLESIDKAIERYKSDNQTLTTKQQKENLAYFVEEFGAYYFDSFLKGKSVDWLFRGGKLKGLRGVFENIHDAYLERLANNVARVSPKEMKFGNNIDSGFRTESGGRVVIPQLDLMMRDLVRASAGNKRSKSFSLKDMTPEQRTTFIAGSGADGLNFTHDEQGNKLPSARTKQLRNEWGKKILASLQKLDPSIKNTFSFTHETNGFSDAQLAHLVNDGVFSKELANRIKAFQEACDPNSGLSNVFDTIYHGMSEEQIGTAQRKYGNDVEARQRTVVVHGFEFSLDAKGNLKFNVKTIDKQLMDSYGNEQWANPEVRKLWGDDRNAFDKSVMDYIENASKDSSVRKESALLLDNGDGLGAERRNVMHQVVAFAKKKGVDYANQPTAEIPRIALHTRMDMSPDLMSHTESNSTNRYVYNDKNAFSFISENFKPSNMESEKTPQGEILKNEKGYSIITNDNGKSKAYDANGNLVGIYSDKESAGNALFYAYEKSLKEKEKISQKIPKAQEVQQGAFMVLSPEQRTEAIKRGNIWSVLKDWVGSGKIIPQTREEFYLQGMVELRQKEPKTIYDTIASIYKQKFEPIEKAHFEAVSRLNKFTKEKFGSNLTPEILNSQNPHIDEMNNMRKEIRRLELMIEYGEPLKKLLEVSQGGKKPEKILTQLNLLRQNSIAYDYIAKNIFGDAYDGQFETGKPFATRATHGTTSEAMLGMQAELSKHGLINNSRFENPADLVGAFLSGETKTSFNYSQGNDIKIGWGTRHIRAAIKMENPFVIDLKNSRYTEKLYSEIFNKAKQDGHDGVVIKNVRDAGQTDTVFVVMADKLKSNVVKLDSHKTTLEGNRSNKLLTDLSNYPDTNLSPLYLPKQQSLPIGEGLMTYSDLGGNFMPSFKNLKAIRESGISLDMLKDWVRSGRLRYGDTTDYAGKPVIIVNYDNTGVATIKDSSGNVLGQINGGVLHSLISGKLNGSELAQAILATTPKGAEGLIARLEVFQKATLDWAKQNGIKPEEATMTFMLSSGKEGKNFSNPEIGDIGVNMIDSFLSQNKLTKAEFNEIFRLASESKITKQNGKKVNTGEKLKEYLNKPISEKIRFLKEEFFPQDKTTFDERKGVLTQLIKSLATQESVKGKHSEFYKNYFSDFLDKMNVKNKKDWESAFLRMVDEPLTRTEKNAKSESIGYGKVIGALDVSATGKLSAEIGKHPAFPVDIRSESGKNPTTMTLFRNQRDLLDVFNTRYNVDVGTEYYDPNKTYRSSKELIISTTVPFGEAMVKKGSHEPRQDIRLEKFKEELSPNKSTKEGREKIEQLKQKAISEGNFAFKVSDRVKKGVADIDRTIFDINKRSIVSSSILSALDDFKEALRKQDATDEIVVKDVEKTHTALLNAIDNEMASSSQATLPDLKAIKKKVELIDRGLKDNQIRVSNNAKKAYESDMAEGADIEAEQIKADKKKQANLKAYQEDMQNGADIESEQAFDKTQERVAQHEANMAEGADIEAEQAFDAKEQSQAEAERQSEAQAQPQPSAQPEPQPQATQAPEQSSPITEQAQRVNPWRYWSSENISKDSGVWKNSINYTIVLLNNRKYKVYNPSGKNIGIYDDLEQAKRRVQREEPKKR